MVEVIERKLHRMMVELGEIPLDTPKGKTVMVPGVGTDEWTIYYFEGDWYYENVNGEVIKGLHFIDVLERAIRGG